VSQGIVEIVVLAAIAMVVISRLYSVLGRRTGSERPEPRPAAAPPANLPRAPAPPLAAPATGAAGGGLADIVRVDPAFDPAHFMVGARKAYEMIVGAFGAGDRDALRPLLTPGVFTAYDKAIAERDSSGAKGPELVRLKSADLGEAELDGSIARLAVKFEAELAEGATGLRDTKERWTFERDTISRDPNWRLAGVAQA
jgi:predicted lipid-binding transport protein (Tim44 family)